MAEAVVVGSGPNGLAAALTLAKAGLQVRVLEASDRLGGGARSADLTGQGLVHDECSAFHPLAVDTEFSRAFDLSAHGLVWRWPQVQYAHPLADGRGAAAWRSVADTAVGLGPDGDRWAAVFSGLVRRFDEIAAEILRPAIHIPRHPVTMARFGALAALPASVLTRTFSGASAQALFAGSAAHALRPLSSPASSAIGIVLAAAAHRYGWPVAEGGSGSISRAMVGLLQQYGATFETGVRVDRLSDLGSPDVVMLDVAPRAAVRIGGPAMPSRVSRALARYRHGPAFFKVDFAVEGGVPWTYEPSRQAGTVHVGGAAGEIAGAERMVHRGRMPERPFVLVGQQYLADPARSRGDLHPVYSYAHVPHGWSGDATAQIEAQIERFAPGFRDRIVGRHVRSVADMEAQNANWVGGDAVTGSNHPGGLLLRPRPALDPYFLGVRGLYLCSAATPPGAGAHGLCGYNAARSALRRLDRRLTAAP